MKAAEALLVKTFWDDVVARFRERMRRVPHALQRPDDIANEAFLKALRALAEGRATETTDRKTFRILVIKIAEDTYKTSLRWHNRMKRPDAHVRSEAVLGVNSQGRPRTLAETISESVMSSGHLQQDCSDVIARGLVYASRYVSDQELKVLEGLVAGRTTKQIATDLDCSMRTVQVLRKEAHKKLRKAREQQA